MRYVPLFDPQLGLPEIAPSDRDWFSFIHREQKNQKERGRRRFTYIRYVTEPGDSCGRINPFLPTRCRPTVEHSLAAGDAQRRGSRRACRMAISRNARFLADFPEFAQEVSYGVLASGKLWKGGRDSNSETFR